MKSIQFIYTLSLLITLFSFDNVLCQQFTKITTGAIVNTPSGSRSCNFIDVNNDNFQDVLITNGTSGGEDNMLYLNNGDGSFSLMNDVIVGDSTPTDGATCADYDNDGFTDVFSVNWYGVDNLLYKNDGGNSFLYVDTSVVSNQVGYSETASWGDFNNDGLLDLYVTNSAGIKRNYLYQNMGGGHFEPLSGVSPVTDNFASRCVNWIDYDSDGDQDLFVTNENNQKNNLYRNDGGMVFTVVTGDPIVSDNLSSMSASWADVDNDGDFDLFIANYEQNNQLFLNDGSGNFSATSGPWDSDVGCSFSASFTDFDNDGDEDVFVTNGYCSNDLKNYLYMNNGDGTFEKDTNEVVSTELGGSYGCAWGDYNNDGAMDLVVANWQGETQPNYLFRNNGNGNNWMKLKLEGTISNRSAIGTIVRCKAVFNGVPVWQTRLVSAQSGYCSQNSLVVHVGLGDASAIDSLEVNWPSGIIQTFTNVNANEFLSLIENGTIGTVDVAENTIDENEIIVFPNPSNGSFTLKLAKFNQKIEGIELLDLAGREVFSEELDVNEGQGLFEVNVKGRVQSGPYKLVIKTEKGLFSGTVIIE